MPGYSTHFLLQVIPFLIPLDRKLPYLQAMGSPERISKLSINERKIFMNQKTALGGVSPRAVFGLDLKDSLFSG
jgi:hypothetical protein